jgi:hypothetical protein
MYAATRHLAAALFLLLTLFFIFNELLSWILLWELRL